MSDLQDALDRWETRDDTAQDMTLIMEAARLWADHQGKCPLLITAVESDQPLYVDPEDVPF